MTQREKDIRLKAQNATWPASIIFLILMVIILTICVSCRDEKNSKIINDTVELRSITVDTTYGSDAVKYIKCSFYVTNNSDKAKIYTSYDFTCIYSDYGDDYTLDSYGYIDLYETLSDFSSGDIIIAPHETQKIIVYFKIPIDIEEVNFLTPSSIRDIKIKAPK